LKQQRWMLAGLVVSSGFAWIWPLLGVEFDPFTASQPYLVWGIVAAMFAVGCLLDPAELRDVVKLWPHVIGGTAVQYTAMPLLAVCFAWLGNFDPVTRIGVIMVGCVPGAMASNVLTLLSRGNVSYSVCLTTLATLLSPIAVPLALWLTLDAEHQIDPWQVGQQLAIQVVLPVVAGFLLCRWSWAARLAKHVAPLLAQITILWVIAAVVAVNRERLHQATPVLILVLLLINLGGYVAGWIAGRCFRQTSPMRRALTLEIGMQNCGLGTVLVLQLYPEPQFAPAAIPTAAYTFGCMLTGILLASWWNRIPVESCQLASSNEPIIAQFPLDSQTVLQDNLP